VARFPHISQPNLRAQQSLRLKNKHTGTRHCRSMLRLRIGGRLIGVTF